MPILPSEHFDFLKEQRTNERQNAMLNQNQINNMIQSMEVNKAFDQFSKDKDAAGFTKRMRTLGTLFGNERLANFQVPDYLMQSMGVDGSSPAEMTPVYVNDNGTLRKSTPIEKNAKVIDMPFSGEAPEGFVILNGKLIKDPTYRPRTMADVKAERDMANEDKANQAKSELVKQSAKDTLDTISEIKKGIKYFGAAGSVPPWPMEYSKVNWKANLDKLLSKKVLDVMNSLKEASKTGATGFGALSAPEMKVLQDASTVIKPNMSETDAARYLDDLEKIAIKIYSGDQNQAIGQQSGGKDYSNLWQ